MTQAIKVRTTNPAADISGILTATGRQAYVNRNRAHLMAIADALREAQALEKKAILKSGKRWLFGLDVRRAAWKITKPTGHAADLCEEAARALVAGGKEYTVIFGGAREAAKRQAFDPTK